MERNYGAAGEGHEPVEDTGVRLGLDWIGEAVAGPDLGTNDLADQAEDVLSELVGDDGPLAGDLGEVPCSRRQVGRTFPAPAGPFTR